jgi:hypothetical protein
MPKLVLNNIPGHYEGSGFEVDITAHQVIVRSRFDNSDQAGPRRTKEQRASPDDGNKSILASIGRIARKL